MEMAPARRRPGGPRIREGPGPPARAVRLRPPPVAPGPTGDAALGARPRGPAPPRGGLPGRARGLFALIALSASSTAGRGVLLSLCRLC